MSIRSSSTLFSEIACRAIRDIFDRVGFIDSKKPDTDQVRNAIQATLDGLMEASYLKDIKDEEGKINSIAESMVIYGISFFTPEVIQDFFLIDGIKLEDKYLVERVLDRCYFECKTISQIKDLKNTLREAQELRSFNQQEPGYLTRTSPQPSPRASPQPSPRGGSSPTQLLELNNPQ
jgi:hypothetical protein